MWRWQVSRVSPDHLHRAKEFDQIGQIIPAGTWNTRVRQELRLGLPETEESIADEPEPVGDLAGQIDELEQEGHALRAKITWLQIAGQTVIAQREHWKSQALAVEELLEAERNRHAAVRTASTRCAAWSRRNCILTSAMAVTLRN